MEPHLRNAPVDADDLSRIRALGPVLVANRGEIACRVIRTLRRLRIPSVAVYSDADGGRMPDGTFRPGTALHVREADHAVRVGPAPAAQSYLDIDALLRAASETGARAVHPGYGFLSESAAFARACEEAGLVFIGPRTHALAVMGDKVSARMQVAEYDVPVVPGFSDAGMQPGAVHAHAEAVGYPLLVKPSAGGGGKGMQVVRAPGELDEAVTAARRIATSSFANDTLLFERLIERPRHIEVQLIADQHGNVVHLGERECTLQRRYQKVIEESPSPIIDEATRARIGRAACDAARSVRYEGAGTVEFLVSADQPEEFFFIEMNTRLQVEHPVTELVTGIDLVEQQLRVAAGLPLDFRQEDVALRGHAVEARVYAESPARGFLPSSGTVLRWEEPGGVRVDAGIASGSVIGTDYDPMLAKVIAHGHDRAEAWAALERAMRHTVLFGVESNLAFLQTLLTEPDARAGRMDTGTIDRMPPFTDPDPPEIVIAAAAEASAAAAPRSSDAEYGVWRALGGWRLGQERTLPEYSFEAESGTPLHAAVPASVTGAPSLVDGDTVWVHADGRTWMLRRVKRGAASARIRRGAAHHGDVEVLRSPMPGHVVALSCADGDEVRAGDRILAIEAMKMEHPVIATHSGTIRVSVVQGEQVRRDQPVAHIERAPRLDEDAPAGVARAPRAKEQGS